MSKKTVMLNTQLRRMATTNPELAKAIQAAAVFEQAGFGNDWDAAPDAVWKQAGMERTMTPDQCPHCKGQGGYYVVQEGQLAREGRFAYCACAAGVELQKQVDARRYRSADIPEKYEEFTFDSFYALPDAQKEGKWEAYMACRFFADRWQSNHYFFMGEVYQSLNLPNPMQDDPSRNSLVLYGDFGVGKTGLMTAIVNHLSGVRSILRQRVQKLIAEIQNTYSKGRDEQEREETRLALIHRLENVSILALDEWTLETVSRDRLEIMESIIRERCEDNLPTLITTNETPDTFYRQWKGRIADVLLEHAHWVGMAGVNLRRKSQPPIPQELRR